MNNVFRTDLPIHRKYDLKGSTLGRSSLHDKGGAAQTSSILKDLDLDIVFKLEEGWPDRLYSLSNRHRPPPFHHLFLVPLFPCAPVQTDGINLASTTLSYDSLACRQKDIALLHHAPSSITPRVETHIENAGAQAFAAVSLHMPCCLNLALEGHGNVVCTSAQ
jgi:Phosphatidylinositol-4-phosphate 5-Kinase